MKKIWILLLMCGWLVAKPLLVVVVHPSCVHCRAWENAWGKSESDVKDKVIIRMVNVTKFDDVTWVTQHFPEALTKGTPHFLVTKSETNFSERGRLVGFANWARFEKQLSDILNKTESD